MIELMITILLLCALAWIINLALASFGAPPVFRQIAGVIFLVILLLIVLNFFGYGPGINLR